MTNTIFEQMGGTYTQVGDYMSPDLLPAEEEKKAHIGIWGLRQGDQEPGRASAHPL